MVGYSSIKKETKDIFIEPGVIEQIEELLIHIQNQPDWTENDRFCSIDYDEITLKNVDKMIVSKFIYDQKKYWLRSSHQDNSKS